MGRKTANRSDRSSGRGVGITLGSLTDVGRVRSSNQDAYCALLAPNAPGGADALLAVADGMGGHAAGDIASTTALQELLNRLHDRKGGTAVTSPDAYVSLLAQGVQQANTAVHEASTRPEYRGMGTTLTVAMVRDASAVLAHVGDSRAYLVRSGQLQLLTQDHSWVAEQVAAGALTPDEARVHPYRNMLTRALGTEPGVRVSIFQADLQSGDVLVLCSDGLHGLVGDSEIAGAVVQAEPQEAAQSLVNLANARGGHDNVTVVVARVGGPEEARKRGGKRGDRRAGRGEEKTLQPASSRRSRNVLLLPLRLLVWIPVKLLLKALWLVLKGLGLGLLRLPGFRRRGARAGPRRRGGRAT